MIRVAPRVARCYNGQGRIKGRRQATSSIRPDITSRASVSTTSRSAATEYRRISRKLLAFLNFRELGVDDLLFTVLSAARRFSARAAALPAAPSTCRRLCLRVHDFAQLLRRLCQFLGLGLELLLRRVSLLQQ